MTYMNGTRSSCTSVAVLAVTLILTACGPSTPPQAQASPTDSASPQASPEVLFAVTEGIALPSQPDTVAIVGLDGYSRAKAQFQPRTLPVVPDAYTPLQGVAQVAGSGVYYIDGAGTVRVLRVGSQPQIVARFLLQPAQENAWFAVSPDGSGAIAGVFTFPALGPVIAGTSWNSLIGPSKFDLETAPAGGQSKTLVHWESSVRFPGGASGPLFPVGWTSAGSVAMQPTDISSQNAWPGGPLYVIDDSGKKTTQLGGSNCDSASITPSGLIPCISGQSVTVRDQSGTVVWVTHVDSFSASSLSISPDGQAISDGSHVEQRVGGMVGLGPQPAPNHFPGFRVEGWLDSTTVVGRIVIDDVHEGNLAWVNLSHPSVTHDLGFKGDFVATLG